MYQDYIFLIISNSVVGFNHFYFLRLHVYRFTLIYLHLRNYFCDKQFLCQHISVSMRRYVHRDRNTVYNYPVGTYSHDLLENLSCLYFSRSHICVLIYISCVSVWVFFLVCVGIFLAFNLFSYPNLLFKKLLQVLPWNGISCLDIRRDSNVITCLKARAS